ncbi:alpha/beta hydrolase [Kribbella sp. NPDC051718]|uniref:alpha/beta fold hydrolase n=1 Tax=Kribbella sp. NPDC051718 TaxID=3155168 RepID=UPI003418CF9C
MSEQKPVVVLVHGAFAESASWNGVIQQLQAQSIEALNAYPVATGGNELAIRPELFHHQFCADVSVEQAALMAATQRPVTQTALTDALPTEKPAWTTIPSWFVISDQDLNIPVAAHRYFAERAGSRGTREVAGGSHALSVSQPAAVAATILEAVAAVAG